MATPSTTALALCGPLKQSAGAPGQASQIGAEKLLEG